MRAGPGYRMIAHRSPRPARLRRAGGFSRAMDAFFTWIENTGLSTWIRESLSILAFPGIIVLHTIGMGLLAGTNAVIDLRILGIAKAIPLKPMERFLPVLWTGLAVNAVSGVLLLIAYPTKALTNPVFYIKLGGIALGLFVLRLIRIEVFRGTDQRAAGGKAAALAVLSLLIWTGTITAGRLLAYTHKWVMVGIPANY